MTTGERIKLTRELVGMTQAELADKLGVSYQSISQWERDVRKPKIETIYRLAEAMNISPSELFSEAELISVALDVMAKAEKTQFESIVEEHTQDIYLAAIRRGMQKLNGAGQQRVADFAVDLAEDLAKIPEYQREPDEK